MRIVIAGAGEVGSHLAKMLSSSSETNNITVLDSNPERLEALAGTTDVLTVEGDPSSIEKLKEAGAGKADLFIAVSPAALQDVNIVSALLAKNLGAKKVAARINNEEYMKAENRLLFTSLGIDLLFYPEKVAAEEISELMKHTASTEFMDFAQGKLQMMVFKLDDGASLIGKRPSDFSGTYKDLPFRVVAISRNGKTIIPHTDTKLKMNDLIFMITKKEGVNELMRYTGKPNIKINSMMILGGGKIGEFVAASATRTTSNIKLIELRKDRCTELSEKFDNILVVNGDGRNSDFLIEEGIKDYDSFVAVTSNTETNHSRSGEHRIHPACQGNGRGRGNQQKAHNRRTYLQTHAQQQGEECKIPERDGSRSDRIHRQSGVENNHGAAEGTRFSQGCGYRRARKRQGKHHRRREHPDNALRQSRRFRPAARCKGSRQIFQLTPERYAELPASREHKQIIRAQNAVRQHILQHKRGRQNGPCRT